MVQKEPTLKINDFLQVWLTLLRLKITKHSMHFPPKIKALRKFDLPHIKSYRKGKYL